MSRVFKRLSSSIPFVSKPTPSKTHLHKAIPSNVFPKDYVLTGVHAGVKKVAGVPDLAVILSTSKRPTTAAACFTRNAFKAAPVLVSNQILAKNGGYARGVVVNSGCANAKRTALLSDKKFKHETLVMSTGVIGQNLPIEKIVKGIRDPSSLLSRSSLGSDFSAWEKAAQAFMTTDTFPKLRARTFKINGSFKPPSPTPSTRSFNSISVDGDMSTNDSIYLLANGAAAPTNNDTSALIDEQTEPCGADLAQLVVRDGEGATKFVTVTVKGAPTYHDAHAIASKISTSALVKTALYGEDANWGRILAATGSKRPTSFPVIDPSKVSVTIVPADGTSPLPVLVNGEPEKVDEDRAKEIMTQEDFELLVDLGGLGEAEAKYWTCDFSYEYVRINGDYRS
ncbi:hypothetical protein BKA70DRAFT_1463439 [Coprinopsis sp. MPI-PUGE-AT-0042]|nr:hypothetical protein BKA70DRAFT_1463439 [Coprinopsis sp. MPI-PUGE-AT-0042]